jgi:hypothetical protein
MRLTSCFLASLAAILLPPKEKNAFTGSAERRNRAVAGLCLLQ